MPAIPWMPLYVGDYYKDTHELTTLEHGAYLLLIMAYWQQGRPLSNSNERLAVVARVSLETWIGIRDAIAPFFYDDGAHWIHNRIEAELDHVKDKSEKASAAGRASAESRLNRRSNERSTDAERTLERTYERNGNNYRLQTQNTSQSELTELTETEITELSRTKQRPVPISAQSEQSRGADLPLAVNGSVTAIRAAVSQPVSPPRTVSGFRSAAAIAVDIRRRIEEPQEESPHVALRQHLIGINRDILRNSLSPPDEGTVANVWKAAQKHVPGITVNDFMQRLVQSGFKSRHKKTPEPYSWGLIVTMAQKGEW